jgi:hypothetical protein
MATEHYTTNNNANHYKNDADAEIIMICNMFKIAD